MEVRITPSRDLMALPDRLIEALTEAQSDSGDLLVERSRDSLRTVGAFATGDTARGVMVRDSAISRTEIFAPSPSRLIEEGRPAGKVPAWSVFEPILERWARAKGLQADNLYPIALKIRREGYPARFPFRQALEDSKADVLRIFDKAIKVVIT